MLVDSIEQFQNLLEIKTGFRVLGSRIFKRSNFDSTRLVINMNNYKVSGFYIEDLRKEYNIQIEMADFKNIVCILGIFDKEDILEVLLNALRNIDKELKVKGL